MFLTKTSRTTGDTSIGYTPSLLVCSFTAVQPFSPPKGPVEFCMASTFRRKIAKKPAAKAVTSARIKVSAIFEASMRLIKPT